MHFVLCLKLRFFLEMRVLFSTKVVVPNFDNYCLQYTMKKCLVFVKIPTMQWLDHLFLKVPWKQSSVVQGESTTSQGCKWWPKSYDWQNHFLVQSMNCTMVERFASRWVLQTYNPIAKKSINVLLPRLQKKYPVWLWRRIKNRRRQIQTFDLNNN